MKNFYVLIVLLLTVACNSQNENLKEAKEELEYSIEYMQSALDSYNQTSVINPIVSNNANHKNSPKNNTDSLLVKKKIANFLDSITFFEKIEYPRNYLELNYEKSDFGRLIRDKKFLNKGEDYEPIFLLEKINFKDKTSKTLSDTIRYGASSSFDKGIWLNSSKPIAQLVVKVIYQYPEVIKISLREDKLSVSLPEGEVSLTRLENNFVSFLLPIDLKDKLADAIAYDTDGQAIEMTGFAQQNVLTEQQIVFLNKVIPIQKTALEKLRKNEFKDKSALDEYINNKTPEEPDAPTTHFIAKYKFAKAVATVDLFLQKGDQLSTAYNITIENDNYEKTKLNFFKALDTLTKKQGFVGLDGNWIKPPALKGLRYESDYYYTAIVNDSLVLLRLNPKKNTIETVDYELGAYGAVHGKLVIIKNKDGDHGIINQETNKMEIPFTYKWLIEDGGLFIVRTNNKEKFGAYDTNMKQVLPEIYDDIDVEEGKIRTTLKIEGQPSKYEVFSLKGAKLKDE